MMNERTCYKRQNDEESEKAKTPHQQANLNLQIEETALLFQNSVLSVSQSDTDSQSDTTRWGEYYNTVEEITTTIDHDGSDREKPTTQETTKEEEQHDEKDEDQTINTQGDVQQRDEAPTHPDTITQITREEKEQTILTPKDDEARTTESTTIRAYEEKEGSSSVESEWGRSTATLEAEYQRLKNRIKESDNETENIKTNKHSLSPFQPIQSALRFHSLRPPSPIIEPIPLDYEGTGPYKNHVQQVTIDTDYSLYDNLDKPMKNEPIQVIYDTEASISMLPAEYSSAWTNLRECLHSLTGCFSGHKEKQLEP
jgi:hypothetical protein